MRQSSDQNAHIITLLDSNRGRFFKRHEKK
jgi:hypothetical protein